MAANKLTALALAFGIIAEGVKATELQEKLDASEGYQMYQATLKAKAEAETAAADTLAKATELEGDLSAANHTIAVQEAELDTIKGAYFAANERAGIAEQKVFNLEQTLAELTEAEEDDRILFTSENGSTYEVIPEKFRFKGTEYQSAEAVENHRDILEAQVAAKSFILKKV